MGVSLQKTTVQGKKKKKTQPIFFLENMAQTIKQIRRKRKSNKTEKNTQFKYSLKQNKKVNYTFFGSSAEAPFPPILTPTAFPGKLTEYKRA